METNDTQKEEYVIYIQIFTEKSGTQYRWGIKDRGESRMRCRFLRSMV